MFILDYTPCGKTVYVTELSTWTANGKPDPLTGRGCWSIVLNKKFIRDELKYFVAVAPSGAFLKLYNS